MMGSQGEEPLMLLRIAAFRNQKIKAREQWPGIGITDP
jgi:hypothetical protein